MKKLIFTINALGGGGAERAASILLGSEIFRREFETHLILLENKIKYELPDGIFIHIATKLGESAGSADKAALLPKMVAFVRRMKLAIQPDISLSFLTRSNILNILTKTGQERIVISERNNPERTYSGSLLKSFIHKKLLSRLYPRADKIITVSGGVRDALLSYVKLDPDRVVTVHNPYDIDKIRSLANEEIDDDMKSLFSDSPVIISVGRLIEQKGQDTLISAMPSVLKNHKVNLVIIGEGEKNNSLKKMAEDLKIADRVHFIGWKKNPFKYISHSSLFVLPSRWEGFPNALVEAMACGCPVIASDCASGPSEILEDNRYGILSEVDNPEDLAAKISEMLGNEDNLKKFSELAKKRADDFQKDKIADKMFEELVGIG
ncbi:MAG: glycosyltransferase [Candidatus Eremiobacteraeota bacterium]|nr:glycosyltransferase [Candidatus Eremiobacteraeota bacterium]